MHPLVLCNIYAVLVQKTKINSCYPYFLLFTYTWSQNSSKMVIFIISACISSIANYRINNNKRIIWCSKDVTQTDLSWPMATLTWIVRIYKAHKLHQSYINTGAFCLCQSFHQRMYLQWSLWTLYYLHARLESLLCLCDIFWLLINSLVCWFCTGILALLLF